PRRERSRLVDEDELFALRLEFGRNETDNGDRDRRILGSRQRQRSLLPVDDPRATAPFGIDRDGERAGVANFTQVARRASARRCKFDLGRERKDHRIREQYRPAVEESGDLFDMLADLAALETLE